MARADADGRFVTDGCDADIFQIFFGRLLETEALDLPHPARFPSHASGESGPQYFVLNQTFPVK
jgi:hypothetical protein